MALRFSSMNRCCPPGRRFNPVELQPVPAMTRTVQASGRAEANKTHKRETERCRSIALRGLHSAQYGTAATRRTACHATVVKSREEPRSRAPGETSAARLRLCAGSPTCMQLLRDLWTNKNVSVASRETPEAHVRSEHAKVVQLPSVLEQTARFAANGEVRKLLLGPLIADRRVHVVKLDRYVVSTPKDLRAMRKRSAHHGLHAEVIQLVVLFVETSADRSTPSPNEHVPRPPRRAWSAHPH